MRRPLPLGLSPRSGRTLAPGRLLRAALRAPSALSRLAKGKTRAAPRRRSADQRPAAARSARLVAGRRIPRRAAGGSLGRHSHAAFFPQGSSPARGQQRALAGALSAIREQAPLAHDPPFNRTQVKLGRWHGRGEAVGVPQRCRGWLWASGLRRARVSSAIKSGGVGVRIRSPEGDHLPRAGHWFPVEVVYERVPGPRVEIPCQVVRLFHVAV